MKARRGRRAWWISFSWSGIVRRHSSGGSGGPHPHLQIIGFIGCAVGSVHCGPFHLVFKAAPSSILIFAGFMIFNLMTNLGPNAMTYLLAGESLSDENSRAGRGPGCVLCQDRGRHDGLSVSHSARATWVPPYCSISWWNFSAGGRDHAGGFSIETRGNLGKTAPAKIFLPSASGAALGSKR